MTDIIVNRLFHQLHAMPELAHEEFKTSQFLTSELRKLGYCVIDGIGGTGVVGEWNSQHAGSVLLLRADMDALPFCVDGKETCIHACGHDANCAMVLAAAYVLKEQIKRGKLRIMFQPAEETLSGALVMIKEGFIEDVDIALGIHLRPVQDIPEGTMTPAVKHGAATFVKIVVNGRNCHASRPHLGVNAADAAAIIVQTINAIRMNPKVSWSCKVTGIRSGGSAPNIIPDKAELIVDVRAQNNELIKELLEKIHMAVYGAAASVGAISEITTLSGIIPAAELDEATTLEIADCISEVVGVENTREALLNTGSEDFHFFTKHKPTLKAGYIGVGAGCTPGLHDAHMHFNIDMLQKGTDVLVKYVLKKLG